jgi:TPR repeat protein
MYEHGDGLALDLRLPRFWFDLAAKAGDVAARGKLKEAEARLAEQRSRALR